MNGFVTKSVFAKIYGCGVSYVTKLKDQKRIVLSEDGKLVNVEASLRLIETTGDPSKVGVRDRWNAYRDGKEVATPEKPVSDVPGSKPAGRFVSDEQESAYHKARTEREQVEAELKKLELAKQKGLIAVVEPIVKAVVDTHMAARTALMQIPERLTQQIAPETDPAKVHTLITEECERICCAMEKSVTGLIDKHLSGEVHA